MKMVQYAMLNVTVLLSYAILFIYYQEITVNIFGSNIWI